MRDYYYYMLNKWDNQEFNKFFFFNVLFILRERERERAEEGEIEREDQNLKQAPGSELSAQGRHGARTHRPADHDLS